MEREVDRARPPKTHVGTFCDESAFERCANAIEERR